MILTTLEGDRLPNDFELDQLNGDFIVTKDDGEFLYGDFIADSATYYSQELNGDEPGYFQFAKQIYSPGMKIDRKFAPIPDRFNYILDARFLPDKQNLFNKFKELNGDGIPENSDIIQLSGEFIVTGEDDEFLHGDYIVDSVNYNSQELGGDGNELGAWWSALGKGFKFKALKLPKFKAPRMPRFKANFNTRGISNIGRQGSKLVSNVSRQGSKLVSNVGRSIQNAGRQYIKVHEDALRQGGKALSNLGRGVQRGLESTARAFQNQQQEQPEEEPEQPQEPEQIEEEQFNQEEINQPDYENQEIQTEESEEIQETPGEEPMEQTDDELGALDFSSLIGTAGTAAGAYFGGPVGAGIGGQIGSMIGSQVGGKKKSGFDINSVRSLMNRQRPARQQPARKKVYRVAKKPSGKIAVSSRDMGPNFGADAPPEPKKDNTLLYAGGAAVATVGIYFMTKKGKR